jgi:hypothetical protein
MSIRVDNLEIRFYHVSSEETGDTIKKIFGRDMSGYNPYEKKGRCTLASISIDNKPKIIGFSFCNLSDNFCKSKGRKLSLARAIKTAKAEGLVNRQSSARIWKSYLESCK